MTSVTQELKLLKNKLLVSVAEVMQETAKQRKFDNCWLRIIRKKLCCCFVTIAPNMARKKRFQQSWDSWILQNAEIPVATL